MKKKVIATFMAACLITMGLTACGSSSGDSGESTTASAGTETSAAGESSSEGSFEIATNNFGAGDYTLDMHEANVKAGCEAAGATLNVVDNEFTVDNVITQLQNQIASGVDAACLVGVSDTVFANAAKLCEEAGIPFVFYANTATDEDLETMETYEYFVGEIVQNPAEEGEIIAQQALDDGCKTAILTTAAIGDYCDDKRIEGFTEVFEAGGGEVVYVAHSSDPSEATQKTNDAVTANPDVDCIYGFGDSWVQAAADIAEQRGMDCKIYGSSINPDVLEYIAEGKIDACTGGEIACGGVAVTLLANYMAGHPILDEDGNAPIIDELHHFVVTPDNAEAFSAFLTNEETSTGTISTEEYQSLLYEYNPDVTIDDYVNLMNTYPENVYQKIGVAE